MMDFFLPFISILAAEFGDKTMLAVLLLGAKTRRPLSLLSGVMFAFLIVDGFAIFAGAWLGQALPLLWVKVFSGGLFMIFGVKIWLEKDEDETSSENRHNNLFVAGFLVVFLAEWGDKTQLASAVFGARYQPWIVLAAAMAALLTISAAAVYSGQWIAGKVRPEILRKAAAGLFLIMGLAFFFL